MSRTKDRRRGVAAAMLLALTITACGNRSNAALHQAAADAAIAGGSGTGSAGSGAGPAGTTGARAGAGTGATTGGSIAAGATGTTTGALGTAGSTTGPGGPAGTTGSTAGSTGPGGSDANGGATDVGVTASSVSVGNVSDLTGPVPGLFEGAAFGLDAYFAYVNSRGGVYGRQLVANDGDSQTSCSGDATSTEAQANKVFAFVGSFAIYDDCGTHVLESHQYADVASISYALGNATKAFRNNFSPEAAPAGYQTGMFAYWKHKYGEAVTKVGSVFPNIAAAVTSQQNFEAAASSVGWHWIYDQSYPATQTNWTSEVVQMKLKGVQLVFMAGQTAEGAATIVSEAHSQGWNPIFVAPIAYASDFLTDLGSPKDAEGISGSNLYALFFNKDEATRLPEVALYQHWMQVTHPGAALDLYSMYSWCSGMLFVQALRAAGPSPTRRKLIAALRRIRSFDAGGLLPRNDPAGKKPPLCYLLWTIHHGAFVRESTPASRFRCDGSFHYNHG